MNRRTILTGVGAALVAGGAAAAGWRGAVGSTAAYAAWSQGLRAGLPSDPSLTDLVRQATLAASGHNTQPWRFALADGAIDIRPDKTRQTPVVDPDDHHLFVSLGCAAENLRIAAGATGRPGELETQGEIQRYVWAPGPARPDPLLQAIGARRTCRTLYDGRALSPGDLNRLVGAAEAQGVRTVLVTEPSRVAQVRDLVIAGNTAQMDDPAFVAELKHWLRYNPRDAMARGDGLYSPASGNPAVPGRLGGLAFDGFVTARSENDRYARQIASSSGIIVFFADRADPEGWAAVGRACQRFMLTATALDIRYAFLNQPVEVPALRPDLAALVGEPGLRPDLLLRFGRGPVLPLSPRRPVQVVIEGAA